MSICVLIESFVVAAVGRALETEFTPMKAIINSLNDFRAVDMHVIAVDTTNIIRLFTCFHYFIHLLICSLCFLVNIILDKRWQKHLIIYKTIK